MITVKVESTGSIEEAFNEAVRSAAQEQITPRLQDYRCPDHDQPIERVTLSGVKRISEFVDNVEMNTSACCDRAAAGASRRRER